MSNSWYDSDRAVNVMLRVIPLSMNLHYSDYIGNYKPAKGANKLLNHFNRLYKLRERDRA